MLEAPVFSKLTLAPAYRQVAESVGQLISSGKLRPGELLPTEMELALHLGVNRSTLREGPRAVEHEGLVMGGSTGINVAGAIRMARDLGPGKTVVTVLCDHGQRYQSKIYNPSFLAEKGLPQPKWLT